MEERRVAVDEALDKMEEKHAQEQEELKQKEQEELDALSREKLSPEELQQRRAQLFNKQQLRQSALDKKQADERKKIQHGAVADWEVRYARAKLEMKEKHYKVRFVVLSVLPSSAFPFPFFPCHSFRYYSFPLLAIAYLSL